MDDYYINQAGSGLGGFAGQRYQKGDGFFGRLISGTVMPIIRKVLPYLGKTAINTGIDILGDVSQGEKFKDSVKRRFRETGERVGEKAMSKVREITGSGRKRRRQKPTTDKKKPINRRKQKPKQRKKNNKSKRNQASDFL